MKLPDTAGKIHAHTAIAPPTKSGSQYSLAPLAAAKSQAPTTAPNFHSCATPDDYERDQ